MKTTKVLVLYYSSYGHVEAMAQAVAAGAREVADTEVTVQARAGTDARRSGAQGRHQARPSRTHRQPR